MSLIHRLRKERSSSFRLIRIGLALTIVLVLCVGWIVWQSYVLSEGRKHARRSAEDVLTLIDYYGTNATRYREATIEYGQQLWFDAYLEYIVRLEQALDQSLDVATSRRAREGAERARELNRRIHQLECDAMTLALEGRFDEARAVSESHVFAVLVREYSEALLEFIRGADPPGSASAARFDVELLRSEIDVLHRARIVGLPIPAQVKRSTVLVGHRLEENIRMLEPDFTGSDDVARMLELVAEMLTIPADDSAAFHLAMAQVDESAEASIAHLDRLDDRREAAMLRERLVVPVLLTFILIVLALAWVNIARVVRRNLAEREETIDRLREMELRNETLMRAIPDLIFLHDVDGNYLDYRAPSDEHLLLPPVQFVNRNIDEVLPHHVAVPGKRAIRRAAETGETQHTEYELDGGIYEARYVPMDGNRVLVIIRNITVRRRAELARMETESKFRTLVEHSLVGTYIIQNERFIYVNPRFAEILGGAPDDFIGRRVLDAVHPDDRHGIADYLRQLITGEADHIQIKVRALHLGGAVIVSEVYGSTTRIDGEAAVIGTVLDVTERERNRREVARLKSFYEETLNRLPIEIMVMDRDLRYVFLNNVAAPTEELQRNLIGRSLKEYETSSGRDSVPYEAREKWLREVVESGRGSSMEEVVRNEDGGVQHLLRVAAPVVDEAGEVQHIVSYALDISERKEYERRLLDAKNRAEEMARLKSAFLANMSHEIRTPLTGILGFASVLEEEVPEEQQQFASLIVRSGRRLLDTLNAVLDLSRLEAGEMRIEIRPTDLCHEAEEVTSFLATLAAEKAIRLEVSAPSHPVRAMADPGALHIVLNNLIGNAIKFTDRGEVRVEVGEEAGRCFIRICDTGVGIDETFIPQLFDEFKQESIGLARSHEGAGLGLAITRRLVLMMEGTIDVESEKGAGTTFSLTFPRASDQLDLPLVNELPATSDPLP